MAWIIFAALSNNQMQGLLVLAGFMIGLISLVKRPKTTLMVAGVVALVWFGSQHLDVAKAKIQAVGQVQKASPR